MENVELVLSLQFYCAYSRQEIYPKCKTFPCGFRTRFLVPKRTSPDPTLWIPFYRLQTLEDFPLCLYCTYLKKKSGKFDFKTRLIEITFCGFCSALFSTFRPPSSVRSFVTSQLLLIIWWFRPQKPYIFWIHIIWANDPDHFAETA